MLGGILNPDEHMAAAQTFFMRIGYAITRWASIDEALFDFCHFALATSERKVAIVFYRSPNISDHAVLTDQLLRESLRPKLLKRWTKIKKEFDKHSPVRNQIAHDSPGQRVELTAVIGGTPQFEVPSPKQWWELKTQDRKVRFGGARVNTATSQDILQHIKDVEDLWRSMLELKRDLPKRPLKSAKQIARGQARKGARSGKAHHKSRQRHA